MVERYRIISADSHVSIPKEQVYAHLPARLRDTVREAEAAYAAQQLAAKPQKAKQAEAIAMANMPNMGKGAPWPAAGRAGESDSVERLKDMDVDGVEAEILYVGSGGASFVALDPKDRLEANRAVNSAAIEWAAVDPKRLMPVYILPITDVDGRGQGGGACCRLERQGCAAAAHPEGAGRPAVLGPVLRPAVGGPDRHGRADQHARRW